MKTVFQSIAIILFATLNSTGQSCEGYFPDRKGTVMETTIYNDKGKKEGVSTVTILDIENSPAKTTYKIHGQMKDEKDKIISESDYEAYCTNGAFYMSMKSMISADQMKAWKDMEVNMNADEIEYPTDAIPGQKLSDAHLTVNTSMSGVKMPEFKIDITERIVQGKESVTTPAGTFECIKITSTQKIKNIVSFEMNTTEWLSKGNGLIKSESFKLDKRKIYTELTSLK
jgi:hypothetical protein